MKVLARVPAGPAVFAAGLLLSALVPAAQARAASREVHKTVPLDASGRLSLSTYKGSVSVSAWERPEAEITARIEPDGDRPQDVKNVERTEIRIEGGGGSVRVESDYDRVHEHHLFWFMDEIRLPFVHYTIRMPATARLEIEDHKSDTKVAGMKSDLRIRTHKGTVQVNGHDGAVDAETHKGDIRVEFARYSRASIFATHKGTIDVRLPRDSRFELDADGGRRGEVSSDFAVVTQRRSRHGGESLRGPVNGGGPTLRFESSRGVFHLHGV